MPELTCDEGVVAPTCPTCGRTAMTKATQFGARHFCCGLSSWRGKPLVSPEVHSLRRIAHAAVDPLWQQLGFRRGEVYNQLAVELGLTPQQCHISLMDAPTLRRTIDAAHTIKARGPTERVKIRPAICKCGNFVSKANREAGDFRCGACITKGEAP